MKSALDWLAGRMVSCVRLFAQRGDWISLSLWKTNGFDRCFVGLENIEVTQRDEPYLLVRVSWRVGAGEGGFVSLRFTVLGGPTVSVPYERHSRG